MAKNKEIKKLIMKLQREFAFLRKRVLAILLYGSFLEGRGRDIDICIVAPKQKSEKIMSEVWRRIDVAGKRYDVYTFEELPLYMKIGIIERNEIIFGDKPKLYEYFYFFRKLWDDQKHRQRLTKKELLAI